MNFVELLTRSRAASTAILHRFLLNLTNEEKSIHAFFEARSDETFYISHIEKVAEEVEIFTYDCGGKANVYRALDEITLRTQPKTSVIFFVDKDLDDIITD